MVNKRVLINKLAEETLIDSGVCELIVDTYEKYCATFAVRPFKKAIDPIMIDWISTASGCQQADVAIVVTALTQQVKFEIKHKLPFFKAV